MTYREAGIAFEIEMDKRPIGSVPSFITDEKNYFLNKAYRAVLARKFTGHNVISQGVEGSLKRISDLQKLTKTINIPGELPMVKRNMNWITFDLSETSDMLYLLSSILNHSGVYNVELMTIPHQDQGKFVLSVPDNNHPYIPKPVIVYEEDKAIVYVDYSTYQQMEAMRNPILKLSYIRKPETIDITKDGEIEVNWVDEIISTACDMALDNIESPRVQSHPAIVTANIE